MISPLEILLKTLHHNPVPKFSMSSIAHIERKKIVYYLRLIIIIPQTSNKPVVPMLSNLPLQAPFIFYCCPNVPEPCLPYNFIFTTILNSFLNLDYENSAYTYIFQIPLQALSPQGGLSWPLQPSDSFIHSVGAKVTMMNTINIVPAIKSLHSNEGDKKNIQANKIITHLDKVLWRKQRNSNRQDLRDGFIEKKQLNWELKD